MASAPTPAVRSNIDAGNEILFEILNIARSLFERNRMRGSGADDDKSGQSEASRKGVRDSSARRRRRPPLGSVSFEQIVAEQGREFRRKRPGFLQSKPRAPTRRLNKPVPAKVGGRGGVGVQRPPPPPRPIDPRRAAFNRVIGGLFKEPGTRELFFDAQGKLRTGFLTPEALSNLGGIPGVETFEDAIERFTQVEQIKDNPRLRFKRPPPSTFVRPAVNSMFGGGVQPNMDPLANIGFSDAALSGLDF